MRNLYEVAGPATVVSAQEERRINVPPLTRASAFAYVIVKSAKATNAFALSHIVVARIGLYHHQEFGRYLGAGVSKMARRHIGVKVIPRDISVLFSKMD